MKNREFDKKAPQNSDLERVTIAHEQGTSEDQNFEEYMNLENNIENHARQLFLG